MTPVFIVFVFIIAFAVWLSCAKGFERLGRYIENKINKFTKFEEE